MTQTDQKTTAPGDEGSASTVEGALNTFNATSKNIQAIASEIFEISNYPLNMRRKPWKNFAMRVAWTKSWRSRRPS